MIAGEGGANRRRRRVNGTGSQICVKDGRGQTTFERGKGDDARAGARKWGLLRQKIGEKKGKKSVRTHINRALKSCNGLQQNRAAKMCTETQHIVKQFKFTTTFSKRHFDIFASKTDKKGYQERQRPRRSRRHKRFAELQFVIKAFQNHIIRCICLHY